MAFGMNFFRRHQGRLILALAVFLMIVWFVGASLTRLLMPGDSAGTMFGKEVSRERFQQVAQVLQALRFKTRPTTEEVWRFLVLEHEADRLGVQVTDEEVTQQLRLWVSQLTNAPADKLDTAYSVLLRQLRINDEWARYAMSRDLRVGKLRSIISGARYFSDAESWDAYLSQYASVKIKSVRVDPEQFMAQVAAPDDAAVTAYYEAHKSDYLVPPKASVEYVAALRADFTTIFPVTDAEVSDYFESRKKEDYLKPLSTDSALSASSESVLSTDTNAAEPEYRALSEVAGEIRSKLVEEKAKGTMIDLQVDAIQQKDKSMQDLAASYGLPYFTALQFTRDDKGAIGSLAEAKTQDKTPAPVMDDIFSKKSGDMQSAEGASGYYLYRVMAIEPERTLELSEDKVRDRVAADYVRAEAQKLARAEAERILADARAAGWGNYEKDPKLSFAEQSLSGGSQPAELFKAAVAAKNGEFGGPVETPEGACVFEVVDRTDPKVSEFQSMQFFYKVYSPYPEKRKFVEDWQNDVYKRANVQSRISSGDMPQRGVPIDEFAY